MSQQQISSNTSASVNAMLTPKKIWKGIKSYEKKNIHPNAKLITFNGSLFGLLIPILSVITLFTIIGAANTKGSHIPNPTTKVLEGYPLYNSYGYVPLAVIILPGIGQVAKITVYKYRLNYTQKNSSYLLGAILVDILLIIALVFTFLVGIKTEYYQILKIPILVISLLETLLIFTSQLVHYFIIKTNRKQIEGGSKKKSDSLVLPPIEQISSQR